MDVPLDLWRGIAPPADELRICVVLPVRDESAGLRRSLAALAMQRSATASGPGPRLDRASYEILLLANNCTDASASIAREVAREVPALALHVAEVQLPPPLANIGHVRRLLMDAAAARLAHAGPRGVIASTDGDTVVAPDWLARTLDDIDAGADAVGGRIVIDTSEDTDPGLRRRRRCDAAYRLACERLASRIDPDPADPWPRHHQHFCGSLAITRGAYHQVGGLPAVTYLEDEALVTALRGHDLRVRHSPSVRVTTSGRQEGRAEVGLAWQLRRWAEEAARGGDAAGTDRDGPMVEGMSTLVARYTARAELRTVWQHRQRPRAGDLARVHRLATRWRLGGEVLAQRVVAASTFGALWAALEAAPGATQPAELVPVRIALAGLRGWSSAARSNTSSR